MKQSFVTASVALAIGLSLSIFVNSPRAQAQRPQTPDSGANSAGALGDVTVANSAAVPPLSFSTQDPFDAQSKSQANVPNDGVPTDYQDEKFRDEKFIQFNFQDEEWKYVIEWFAKQANFSINWRVPPPVGPFSYSEKEKMTVNEGLDMLNVALSLQGYSLIRKRELLILTNNDLGFPPGLVESISPEQLDSRANYEVVQCEFPIHYSIKAQIGNDVQQLISDQHRDGFKVVDSADKIYVRETVGRLREIRELINESTKKAIEGILDFDFYRMKNVEAESLMFNIRQLMAFPGETNILPDGTLSVSIEQFGDRIFLKGTPERIAEFKKITALVDVPVEAVESNLSKPYFQTHPVTTEPEVTFKIINSMLDGEEGVKMDQDADSGNIYLWARKEQHDRVDEAIAKMSAGDNFAIVPVKNEDPDDMIDTIEELLGLDQEGAKGPSLVSDFENDRIVVYGSPQDILKVQSMIEQLDSSAGKVTGPRKPTRLIEVPQSEADRIMQKLSTGWFEVTGRQNKINLVMPKERASFRSRLTMDPREVLPNDQQPEEPAPETVQPPSNIEQNLDPERLERMKNFRGGNKSGSYKIQLGSPQFYTSTQDPRPTTLERRQDDDASIGRTSQESNPPQDENRYHPPEEVKSVPGAPIECSANRVWNHDSNR